MAVLFITEYADMAQTVRGGAQVAQSPAVAAQTVAIAGSSAQSSAFNVATTYIRVHTDAICSIVISTNPTATATSKRMAADQTEYFGVPVGQSYKVAVISNT